LRKEQKFKVMPNQKLKTDKINRDLFKDMPSALRDNEDIKSQKSMDRLKGIAKAFAVATAAIVGTALFMDKDTPDNASQTPQRTEVTIDNSPE
jgi:hypothetical protein